MRKLKDPFREKTSRPGSINQACATLSNNITGRCWYRPRGLVVCYISLDTNLRRPLWRSLNEKT